MRPSVVQLRQFYSSRLGRRVKHVLRAWVQNQWDVQEQECIAGLGYAVPLLRVLERAGATTFALMPADQGAIYWPVHTDNRSLLTDEMVPPLAPGRLQRVLMVHMLEYSADAPGLLSVYWHMLAPGGRLLVVVPNRRGLWAHTGRTPFAKGTRWNMGQLKDAIEDAQFTLRESTTALFAPPSTHPLWQRVAHSMEWLGRMLAPGFGGVLVIEAEKQIYAGLAMPIKQTRRPAWKPSGAIAVAERRGR